MICEYCQSEFQARRSGKAQRFCPGGDCRKVFYAEARRVGAGVLTRTPRDRSQLRGKTLSLLERAEREASASGYTDTFPARIAKPAPDLRAELGRAARRLGLFDSGSARADGEKEPRPAAPEDRDAQATISNNSAREMREDTRHLPILATQTPPQVDAESAPL